MSFDKDKTVHVGIAIVQQNGKFLVGERSPERVLAGYAEFPGGKCNENESSADCAVRECLEETGLNVVALDRLENRTHAYDHAVVEIDFWLCQLEPNSVDKSPHGNFHWVTVDELKQLKFPKANNSVLKILFSNFD